MSRSWGEKSNRPRGPFVKIIDFSISRANTCPIAEMNASWYYKGQIYQFI